MGNQSSDLGNTAEHEKEVRNSVNRPNEDTGLATQISHKWMERAVKEDKTLTAKGRKLIGMVSDFREGYISCPYERWISLVTGRQFDQHSKSKGSTHNIQHIVKLPDNIISA